MEEQVGELWHRLITRVADPSHRHAEIRLSDISKGLGVFFRALGGDAGLQIEVAEPISVNRQRNWLQRLAGSGGKIEAASVDRRALKLPSRIAWFDKTGLNRDLYYWLTALAAHQLRIRNPALDHWINRNQLSVLAVLSACPGLRSRYQRLVVAHLDQRPHPDSLRHTDRLLELAIRSALLEPGSVTRLPMARRDAYPVPLWLYQTAEQQTVACAEADEPEAANDGQYSTRELEEIGRRQAQRLQIPEQDRGLVTIRMENIFTWGEFVHVDRGHEDEEDADRAESIARDLDTLAVSREKQASGIRLKFDLDLPSEAEDELILSDGILLPEWDWKKRVLMPNHCRIVEMMARHVDEQALPERLKATARKLKNQFQRLTPARTWLRQQIDGLDIDLEAYLRFAADKKAGLAVDGEHFYRDLKPGNRDMACLLLADLSLSTDSWVGDHQRVIDVIRDSLWLFAESLNASGDAFSMIGFSSRKRDPVRVHLLKRFDEPYSAMVRGRIGQIKPGYYTRLGAAIRYASQQLVTQVAARQLLLILTDGKPNDLDQYEGRYGIEDTRRAIREARQLGLRPFCVTIDHKANDYLPHLFGKNGYVVIHNPLQMPRYLPRLYVQMTQ